MQPSGIAVLILTILLSVADATTLGMHLRRNQFARHVQTLSPLAFVQRFPKAFFCSYCGHCTVAVGVCIFFCIWGDWPEYVFMSGTFWNMSSAVCERVHGTALANRLVALLDTYIHTRVTGDLCHLDSCHSCDWTVLVSGSRPV